MKPFLKHAVVIFCCFVLLANKLGAKNPELRWAIFHPVAALKVKRINTACAAIYADARKVKELDTLAHGGKLDAFRHLFFMAAFAQKISSKKLRKLGKAHEKKNYMDFLKRPDATLLRQDSLSSVMDLLNNELAFAMGKEHQKASLIDLKDLVILKIKGGEAFIMLRDSRHRFLNCEHKAIDFLAYEGKWFVPKCLVKSNTAYID